MILKHILACAVLFYGFSFESVFAKEYFLSKDIQAAAPLLGFLN